MKAKSLNGKSIEEIESLLTEALSDGFIPTLATVFVSIHVDRKAICEVLNKRDVQIFGATTDGEVIDSRVEDDSISILLLEINPDYFKVLFRKVVEGGYGNATRKLASESREAFENPAFVFAGSGIWKDPYIEPLVEGFKDILGDDVTVFGGMAGDGYQLGDTYIFTNNWESKHGAMVIAFDGDKIAVNGTSTCGWKAIGTEKTVTESERNKVFAIEGESPLDITLRYAGITDPPENLHDLYTELNHTLQIQLQKEKGEPIMRVGIINPEDHSLSFIGSMPEGSKIKYCLLPDLDVLDECVVANERLKKETPNPDAILVFSCAGRKTAFGPEISKEVEGIYDVWGVPMAGLFCQGELGRAEGGILEVHNLTSCCIALKEINE